MAAIVNIAAPPRGALSAPNRIDDQSAGMACRHFANPACRPRPATLCAAWLPGTRDVPSSGASSGGDTRVRARHLVGQVVPLRGPGCSMQ